VEPPPPPPPALTASVNRVALLLPLTGANGRLGNELLNAAQLAFFDFADDDFELVVHDTKSTSDGAADAATLAIGDGASLLLGPLVAAEVRAVAPAAAAAGINVIAFSSDRTVAGNGTYIMGFLPSAQVERIVGYARARGLLRFAVFVPDDDYGAAVVDALRDAAARVGAAITRVQYYDPAAEDFSDAVRRLADYDSRRGALLAQRAELEGRDDQVARRALRRLEKLQTIGDLPFDALLLPDGGKRLQAIAALLPFYDIDPAKIRILGTGQWDEPGIGAEPALLGGWFAAPSPAARASFEARFARAYGRRPPRLATLAYDAAALAAVLARGEDGPDFCAEALTTDTGFRGRDGIFRFLDEGVSERGLAVLQVLRRGAKVISQAPEAFGVPTN
jgi:ABC-type branched-subunit amino acid transport system substrate-binding protein